MTLLTLAGATQAAYGNENMDVERAWYFVPPEETTPAVATEPGPGETSDGFEWGRFEMVPYASAQYSRESNVFRFSNEVADVTGTSDTADRIQRYLAGLDTSYTWQQQKLMATVEGRTFDYDTYTHLDHSERLLRLSYVGGFWDHTIGLLNLSDERRMASFEDRRSTDLVIERQRIVEGGVEVAVTPEWRILGGTRHSTLSSPLPEAPALPQSGVPARAASPDFEVEETALTGGVQYGIESAEHPETEAPLLLGLMLEHETVRFSGFVPDADGVGAEDYRLLGLEATAQYAVSGLSTLNASMGATQFESLDGDSDSSIELTGEIRYTRELSAVTEVNARVFRRFSPFVPSAEVTTDTGVGVGAKWEPILDIALLLDYSRTESEFGDHGDAAPENTGREDTTDSASLSLLYTRIEYFGLRLFGTRDERDSNLGFNNFSANTVGAELTFRWE